MKPWDVHKHGSQNAWQDVPSWTAGLVLNLQKYMKLNSTNQIQRLFWDRIRNHQKQNVTSSSSSPCWCYRSVVVRSTDSEVSLDSRSHQQENGRAHCDPAFLSQNLYSSKCIAFIDHHQPLNDFPLSAPAEHSKHNRNAQTGFRWLNFDFWQRRKLL